MTTLECTLLVVEDDETIGRGIARFMSRHVTHVELVGSAAEARDVATLHASRLDVVVVDITLPDGNGLDLVQSLRAADPSLGAVVATGVDDGDTASRSVALGVQGYLLKPFRMNELLVNVLNAARWRELDQAHRRQEEHLTELVRERTAELESSRWETIQRLSLAAEHRDAETGDHLERMSAYSAVLARLAGLSPAKCEEIRLASPMHDLGKIAIPDEVLCHPGTFSAQQRRVMNEHTLIGYRILAGSASPLLETAAVIARSHHEWWDGSGYPLGLSGENIPLVGRIVAIADVFDALSSPRRYKRALTFEESLERMRQERGTHFDPNLLDVFVGAADELRFIRDAHSSDAVVV